jgi:hypothetical protein
MSAPGEIQGVALSNSGNPVTGNPSRASRPNRLDEDVETGRAAQIARTRVKVKI